MANYYPIDITELQDFLSPLGFQEIQLAGVHERVFAKRVDRVVRHGDTILGTMPLSLRVFTGIEGAVSRGVGEDAIRVTVFWKDSDGEIKMAGGSKRVHRVDGWKKNLKARIDNFEDSLGPVCSCGAPMVSRKVKATKKSFYGCARYPVCKNTRQA